MNTTKTNEFEQVDINAFIEPAEISKREEAEKAEVFTQKQRDLLNQIMPILLQNDKERYELFLNRIVDMENIASSVAKFPSLLERRELAGGTRTRANLIESLIKHKDDGEKDSIEFTCTKPSKDKQIKKSVYLHNNRIETTMFN